MIGKWWLRAATGMSRLDDLVWSDGGVNRTVQILLVILTTAIAGCDGCRNTVSSSRDIRPLVETEAIKPLPPEYRIVAGHLGQSLKSNANDFRDDKTTSDIIAEGHAAVLDLRAIKSSDSDISYIASQGATAYAEAVNRLERINALPKPPSAGNLFAESFVHGLYGNVYAGYALGVDADNKQKAILNEVTGLVAAVEKADAAHLLLPRVAERYAAPLNVASGRVVVDLDESWNAWSQHDWLKLYNAGGAIEDCTVVVELKNAAGQSRKNVHFVKHWAGNSWLFARYDQGTQIGDRFVGSMTVADVATVSVRVLSPRFSTELQYTYAGAEKAKDVARLIAQVRPRIACRVRDSHLGASSGKVVVLDNQLTHRLYKVRVQVRAANGATIGDFVRDRFNSGTSLEVGNWQVSRNLAAGDRVTVWVGEGILLSGIVQESDTLQTAGTIEVNREKAGEWELFEIIPEGSGFYGLKFHTGYLCAEGGGGNTVIADRSKVGSWERWELVSNNDNTVSFKSVNGYYLCASGGGGGELIADRTSCGQWEKFILTKCGRTAAGRDVFSLRAANGLFVSAQP